MSQPDQYNDNDSSSSEESSRQSSEQSNSFELVQDIIYYHVGKVLDDESDVHAALLNNLSLAYPCKCRFLCEYVNLFEPLCRAFHLLYDEYKSLHQDYTELYQAEEFSINADDEIEIVVDSPDSDSDSENYNNAEQANRSQASHHRSYDEEEDEDEGDNFNNIWDGEQQKQQYKVGNSNNNYKRPKSPDGELPIDLEALEEDLDASSIRRQWDEQQTEWQGNYEHHIECTRLAARKKWQPKFVKVIDFVKSHIRGRRICVCYYCDYREVLMAYRQSYVRLHQEYVSVFANYCALLTAEQRSGACGLEDRKSVVLTTEKYNLLKDVLE